MGKTIYNDDTYGMKMVARAQRFPIQATMQYRVDGEERWYAGTVENISSTGILFHGDHSVELDSPIEVTVSVPARLAGGHSSKMVSRGRIVRSSPCEGDQACILLGAVLYHLRILRE